MARNFGGRFSPDGQRRDRQGDRPDQPRGAMRHRLESRPKWVTIGAAPFLITAFFQPPVQMVAGLAAFGLIACAMWLTREGLRAESAYDVRRKARRPAIPRKLFGGVLAGLGLGLGAAEPGAGAGAALIGVTGLALHWLAFGADPMRDKGMSEGEDFQQTRAERMIEEGEAYLAQIDQAMLRLGDRGLQSRVARFAGTVRDLFDRVRSNPGDLSAARRYLGVYLMGARDATEKFAALYARSRDPATRTAYEAFLDDLERDFSAKARKLLEGDRADLEIEISVLRDRLAREGVASPDRPNLTDSAQFLDDLLRDPADRTR